MACLPLDVILKLENSIPLTVISEIVKVRVITDIIKIVTRAPLDDVMVMVLYLRDIV